MSRFCRLCLMFVFLVSRIGLVVDRWEERPLRQVVISTGLLEPGFATFTSVHGDAEYVLYVAEQLVSFDLGLPFTGEQVHLNMHQMVTAFINVPNWYLYGLHSLPSGDYWARQGDLVTAFRFVTINF